MSNAIQKLKAYSHTLTDLTHTLELLHWDQETYIPAQAHNERGDQIATLTKIIHEYQTSDTLRTLLENTYIEQHNHPDTPDFDKGLLRVMQRNYDQSTKLPAEFVEKFSETTSKALSVWVDAKQSSDFSKFAPTLETIVELCRQKAQYLGYTDSPYDALLDLYEEGLTSAEVTQTFSQLKEGLVPLIPQISTRWNQELAISQDIPLNLQQQLADEALAWIGYDITRGRQDTSAHPFTITLGHHDRRVTNRYRPRDLSCIFSALHEGGHALYEQGISTDLIRTPLDEGVSLGIHESQSRLWENLVGRSKAFWTAHFPRVQELIGDYLNVQNLDDWYRAINHVKPSLIRTDADEVTYCMHIIIRFEIEKQMIEGALSVQDVREAWNAKYQAYLGVDVPDDAHGVLQDIHWSYGNHGYFPTYALGTIASTQIFKTFTVQHPGAIAEIEAGQTLALHQWLTDKIYRHGAVFPAKDLLRQVTGSSYDSQVFIQYLKDKFLG